MVTDAPDGTADVFDAFCSGRNERSEILWDLCATFYVPIFDASVWSLHKAQKTAGPAVIQGMAPRLDHVARFDAVDCTQSSFVADEQASTNPR